MERKEMYKCQSCGKMESDQEFESGEESGSGGYCYCEYIAFDGSDVWFPRILNTMVRV
jgi:hypothetical protein